MKTVNELLKDFSGVTPIFPLPEYVFFPKTVQPFHIFEPRYLDMVKDVLKGEGLLTITLLKESEQEHEQPAFYDLATLGFLHQQQELEDGTKCIAKRRGLKVTVTMGDKSGSGLMRKFEVGADPVKMLQQAITEINTESGFTMTEENGAIYIDY